MASLCKKYDLLLEPRAQVSSIGLKSIKVDHFQCFDCSCVRSYGHYENHYVNHNDSGGNYPPTKSEGYSFGVVRPSALLSVRNHISVPIGHI